MNEGLVTKNSHSKNTQAVPTARIMLTTLASPIGPVVLLFSIIVKDEVNCAGNIEHLTAPRYHGDPSSALCRPVNFPQWQLLAVSVATLHVTQGLTTDIP